MKKYIILLSFLLLFSCTKSEAIETKLDNETIIELTKKIEDTIYNESILIEKKDNCEIYAISIMKWYISKELFYSKCLNNWIITITSLH